MQQDIFWLEKGVSIAKKQCKEIQRHNYQKLKVCMKIHTTTQ